MSFIRIIKPLLSGIANCRTLGTSTTCFRVAWDGKKKKLRERSEGTEGEKLPDIHTKMAQICEFPDENLHELLIGDQKFVDIPILHIKSTKNNTLMTIITAHDHPQYKSRSIICQRTCGMDGFKHCRKGTNVAAQTTGLNLGKVALQKGVDSVRVMVRGVGPGRMASVKGMEMSGVKIVSITDATEQPNPKMRPRKARRI